VGSGVDGAVRGVGVEVGEQFGEGAAVPGDGECGDVGGRGRAVGSQKISMSARRCRASWRLRSMATPPWGCGPVVVNPASYRHPASTTSDAGACSGGGGVWSVVVCVSGTRLPW